MRNFESDNIVNIRNIAILGLFYRSMVSNVISEPSAVPASAMGTMLPREPMTSNRNTVVVSDRAVLCFA